MQPLASTELEGNWGTLLLPVRDNDSIDFKHLSSQLDRLIEFGVDGIYTNGTAGEFYNQTEDEFDRISALVAERCHAAMMPFQIGVSHPCPLTSRDRLQRTVRLRPCAVQLILPDWSAPAIDESIAFLRGMAKEAGEIGLVLYNPPHAKKVLSPREFAEVKAAVPSLIGIKVVGDDAAWLEEMQQECSDVSVFVAGHLLADGIPHGARGSYSNVACLHPLMAQQWYQLMRSELGAAREFGSRIKTLMNRHIAPYLHQGYSNQAVDKLLACIGNWANLTPRLRWPYRSIPGSEAQRLRPIADDLIPELPAARAASFASAVKQQRQPAKITPT